MHILLKMTFFWRIIVCILVQIEHGVCVFVAYFIQEDIAEVAHKLHLCICISHRIRHTFVCNS